MKKRVLLADDDKDDILLFEEVFASLPADEYELLTVGNGEAVMALLNEISDANHLPHLIILDQNMPLMSGKETLIQLKSTLRYKDIPVIIYSTYNDRTFIDECSTLKAQAVISKPDSYEGYIRMINSLLKYTSEPLT